MFTKIIEQTKTFLAEDDGPTAIEYVVMLSLVVVVCLVTINAIGQLTQTSFDTTSDSIESAME